MKWNGYEFDEAYRPGGFMEAARENTPFGVAFYLRGKHIFQDAFEEQAGKIEDDEVFIFCPKTEETFEADKSVAEREPAGCHCGAYMRTEPKCPRERECAQTCYLKNAVYRHPNLSSKRDYAFFQRTDRGVVLRGFRYEIDFSGEPYELRRYGDESLTEWLRVFFNADRTTEIYSKMIQHYSGNAGYFTKPGSYWKKKKEMQSYADYAILCEDYKNTLLEGYAKYFERTESYITGGIKRTLLLLAMFRTPALKEVIKAGYESIVAGYISTFETADREMRNARTIKQFFGFEISKLNKLREKQKAGIGMQSLLRLRKLIGEGIAVTPETLAMCGNYRFNDLCVLYEGKALRRVIRYLRRQDIKASDVISDYLDYLVEVKTLRLDERNPEVLYPRSLSRAHARLSRAVEYQTTEKQAEKFAKKAAAYAGYCYRQKNLSLRVIRTASELMKWSQRFCNCSHGYVDNVANGYSLLCVIVDVRKPKDAYFMLDYNVKTHSIAQCRGYHNYTSMEDDPRVERFCGQWLDYIGRKEAPKQRGAA